VTAITYKNFFLIKNVPRPGKSSYIRMTNKQMYIYEYIQLHIKIFHQNVSVTPVTIIRVSY